MWCLAILALITAAVSAQYDSPTTRYVPAGAVQVGRPSGFRQGRLQIPQAQQHPVARVRRPLRPSFKSVDPSPRPFFQSIEEPVAKPVTEEPEDELQDVNTPTAFSPVFSTEPNDNILDFLPTTTQHPKLPLFSPTFAQPSPSTYRPEPQRQTPPATFRPFANPTPVRQEAFKPQPARVQPLSQRPQRPHFRPEPRPQLFQEDENVPIQPVRQYNRAPAPEPTKPLNKPQKYTGHREKKPVAQVIRKFREDNPDGSITWGYENDDGSFKEETLGVDCVTRGKYGYVDPDGLKREYSYETGIPCDKNNEDEDEKGFIDWQDNKAVLPNGVTLDFAAMAKKSRRPLRSPSNH